MWALACRETTLIEALWRTTVKAEMEPSAAGVAPTYNLRARQRAKTALTTSIACLAQAGGQPRFLLALDRIVFIDGDQAWRLSLSGDPHAIDSCLSRPSACRPPWPAAAFTVWLERRESHRDYN
jgi:hypothetical protein